MWFFLHLRHFPWFRLIERFRGDPEAVLKSWHLSDYGSATSSRIRLSDVHVFSTPKIYLVSCVRDSVTIKHVSSPFGDRICFLSSWRKKNTPFLQASDNSVWKRCEAALLGFQSKSSITSNPRQPLSCSDYCESLAINHFYISLSYQFGVVVQDSKPDILVRVQLFSTKLIYLSWISSPSKAASPEA